MKKTVCICVFSMLLSSNCLYAQFGKDLLDKAKNKAKDKAKTEKNKVTGGIDLKNPLGSYNLGMIENKTGTFFSDYSQKLDANSFNYAIALSDNAGLYENQSVVGDGLQKFNTFRQTADLKSETPLQKASGQNQYGEMAFAGYKFEKAEKNYLTSLQTITDNSLTGEPIYSLVLSNLGLMYETTGRYSKSEEYAKQAVEARKAKAEENPAAYAASLNNLAVLYKDQGEYNEAEQYIDEALQYQEKTKDGKNSVTYALMLNNKAFLYQMLGRYDKAEPLMKLAIETADKNMKEKSPNFQRYMSNLAFLYKDMGKLDESEKIYQKALKIVDARVSDTHPDYAALLNNLASLYMQMGKYDKVEEYLKKAADIYKTKLGENHPAYAKTISNLGNYYRVRGRLSEAEPLLQKTIDIRKASLGESHPDYIDALESMALLKWQDKKINVASDLFKQVLNKELDIKDKFFTSMSEAEKAKFWDRLSPKFQKFNAFAVEASKTKPDILGDMYNYQLATKALLLSGTNKLKQKILSGSDADLKKKYTVWIDGKKNLANVYTYSKEELQAEGINRDSLELAVNTLEKEISKKVSLKEKLYSYKDIQTKIAADAAAVEIIRFPKFNITTRDSVFYAALIVTKEKAQPQLVVMENGKDMEKKFYAYYKNTITGKKEDKVSYANYWEKIDKSLGVKKTVYLSLDGIYNQININTLKTPAGTFLLDTKNLILVTNTKDLATPKNIVTTAKPSAVLIGFPNYGNSGSISPLPGTKVEIEGISPILKTKGYTTKVWMQNDANEKNIKTTANPKVLHVATHGFFLKDLDEDTESKVFGIEPEKAKENPLLRAGIMLAGAEATADNVDTREVKSSDNGILTAYEAMNMTLDQTDLVVLSACETGLGDIKNGEGVYGLQRAFQVAGAKSLLMSLWKVSDEATKDLMTNFYNSWTTTGNKVQAFKTAQLQLKTKYKDPYYWGAFVLVGN